MTDVDRLHFERQAREQGFTAIAGVDEVGRASWAGPMVAAAVILGEDFDPTGIRDTKKMGPQAVASQYLRILAEAKAVAIWHVEPADIDARGTEASHMHLLRDVVLSLDPRPDYVLVDHYRIPDLDGIEQLSISHGDDQSASIGAAAIVAKTVCDRLMEAYDAVYPRYGFAEHKGYGVPRHREALERWGPSPIHRRSVGPIKGLST
jgi:ribonuclease HII